MCSPLWLYDSPTLNIEIHTDHTVLVLWCLTVSRPPSQPCWACVIELSFSPSSYLHLSLVTPAQLEPPQHALKSSIALVGLITRSCTANGRYQGWQGPCTLHFVSSYERPLMCGTTYELLLFLRKPVGLALPASPFVSRFRHSYSSLLSGSVSLVYF